MAERIYGYARVSTQDQELARQIDALEKYGVNKIFTEKMTGTKAHRPELDKLKKVENLEMSNVGRGIWQEK